MKRSALLDKLDKAADRAASYAIQSGLPLRISEKAILIGSNFVEKNKNGLYDVLGIDKSVIYKDISVFDVAIIVAQRHNTHETGAVKEVLYLEERFSKYHTDMVYYLHCMKSAKKKHDAERMAILEDKFQLAEQYARNMRDSISAFKRVK